MRFNFSPFNSRRRTYDSPTPSSAVQLQFLDSLDTALASLRLAFDHKQKHKNERGADLEAYPSLLPGSGPGKLLPNGKKAVLEKPFSSVVVAPTNFPSLMDDAQKHGVDLERGAPVTRTAQRINGDVSNEAYQKLKHVHSWADEALIQDVLAGVDYNTAEALSLLEAMRVPDGEAENKNVDSNCGNNDVVASSILCDSVSENYVGSKDAASSLLLNGTAITQPPIEPEFDWEEDDLYLIHRTEAIKMMRSASRHSTTANDAFLRGDHVSAHLFSIKARDEWAAAEKLNAKAAMEILTLRNNNNDPWTLDLHGLHAGEAVEALKGRLQKVESLVVSSNDSVMPTGYHRDSILPVSSSAESLVNMEKLERQHPSLRQRPMLLQVITGKGNHSRGEAALPQAIRNFLNEYGYHFDATRPGVVMVRPKFRQQRPIAR